MRTLLAAAAVGLLSLWGAPPAQAQQLLNARAVVVDIMVGLDCFASDAELASAAAARGLSRRELGDALRFMRSEGVIDSGSQGGVPVIRLLGEAGCAGPRAERIENPLRPGTPTQVGIEDVVFYMEAVGCVAQTSEIRSALRGAGASDDEILGVLQLMGQSGSLQTVRGPGPQGVRLRGTARCP